MYATKEYVDRGETMLAMKLRMVKEDLAAMSGTVVDIQIGQRRLEGKVDGLDASLRAIMDHLGVVPAAPALRAAPGQAGGDAE